MYLCQSMVDGRNSTRNMVAELGVSLMGFLEDYQIKVNQSLTLNRKP